MSFEYKNPNPKGKNVGDCTVRAIALATNQEWEKVYLDICLQGYVEGDMPSSNSVWGKYLTDLGWNRAVIPADDIAGTKGKRT